MSERKEFWNIECEYCGYKWVSQARLGYVTCPNCQQKTKKIKSVEDWDRIKRRKENKKRWQKKMWKWSPKILPQ